MIEAIITLALTTALLLGSPGPAPLALAGVGASFGFKQGLGFLAGILLGLLVAISLVALGLGSLFEQFPTVKLICQGIATAYLIYVAYKIASNTSGIEQRAGAAPSFKDGFILNLINPKAYAAFLAIFANFMIPASSPVYSAMLTATVSFIVAVIVDALWMAIGSKLRPFFAKPEQAKWLRIAFALLLLVSIGASYFL